MEFDYGVKTKIYFGEGKEKNIGQYIEEYGYHRVLIHYGKNSVKKSGLLDIVIDSLKKHHLEYVELGGVEANPDISLVREGIKRARENHIDIILALGGGSVLDSSKLIAHGYYYQGDAYDISLKKYVSHQALPVCSILTIAAAGSEMSASCVISDREHKIKQGFLSELNRPLFVIENPSLTMSLPLNQVGYGIVDMFSHTFERYFNYSHEIEFADYLAEGVMKCILDAAKLFIKDPSSYLARENLMIASSYAHNGLTSIGKKALMPIHKLEHEMSALDAKIAHGAGLAILIPSWMKVIYKYDKEKFIKFAKNVMMLDSEDEDDLILKAISTLQDIFVKLGMPTSLHDVNLDEKDIEYMSSCLSKNQTTCVDAYIPLDHQLILQIYRDCL